MARGKTTTGCLDDRGALALLTLLLSGDAAYIIIHIVNAFLHHIPIYSIEFDHSYSEFYGYMKLFWICLLLIYIQIRDDTWHYSAWFILFAYFLADDSVQIHELAGLALSKSLQFQSYMGLRPEDFGELTISATVGSALSIPLMLAYRKGTDTFKSTSHDLALLVFILAGFGIAVDMLHSIFSFNRKIKFLFGIIEDGGEMITVSFILWYVFSIATSQNGTNCYLCGWIKDIFLKYRQPSP